MRHNRMTIDLIKHKHWFLGLSAVLVVASIVSIVMFGFRQGIDLAGGSQWQFRLAEGATEASVKETLLRTVSAYEPSVKRTSEGSFLVRLPSVSHEEYLAYRAGLERLSGFEEENFSNIGPTIGSELRRKAMWAIVLVLLGISFYVAFAFRKVSEPVRSWKYGVVTLITLFHDVIIPAGLIAVLGYLKGIEIDTNFIVALLVVMGFSVHDTIVVFDRIREKVTHDPFIPFTEAVNASLTETLARSINTSFVVVLTVVAMLLIGGVTIRNFLLVLLVGIVSGTYSSIGIASQFVVAWENDDVGKFFRRLTGRKEEPEAELGPAA